MAKTHPLLDFTRVDTANSQYGSDRKPNAAGAVHNRQTEIDALVAPEKRHFNRALVSLVNAFVFGAILGALACYLILKQ